MTENEKYVSLGSDLAEMRGTFRKPSVEFLESWEDNFSNSNTEVLNVILKSDSELRPALLFAAYRLSVEDLSEEIPFKYLNRIRFYDRYETMTLFGLMLVELRFSLGFLGNMKSGDLVSLEECEALIFAYEAYWKFGSDFLLGAVVDVQLSRLPDPRDWQWPDDDKFGNDEKLRQFQKLGYEIGRALKVLSEHYRLTQPSMTDFLPIKPAKPDLEDFRKTLSQISAEAKIEKLSLGKTK